MLAGLQPAPPVRSDARARELIQALKLEVLPKESGYLAIIGRSAQTVTVDGRTLVVQSQNYYMLTRDRPVNYLHWLAPDDTHIRLRAARWTISSFIPTGARRKLSLALISLPESGQWWRCRQGAGKLSVYRTAPGMP
jgi:hypothetical protein